MIYPFKHQPFMQIYTLIFWLYVNETLTQLYQVRFFEQNLGIDPNFDDFVLFYHRFLPLSPTPRFLQQSIHVIILFRSCCNLPDFFFGAKPEFFDFRRIRRRGRVKWATKYLAKLQYFTNLDFPEIRGFP